MAVRQRGKGWQVDVTLVGHGRLRPFFETEEQAKTWEADARHAAAMGRPLPSVEGAVTQGGGRLRTMKQLLPIVVEDWKADNCGERSISIMKRNVEVFLEWFGENREPIEVTEEVIDEYIIHLRTEQGLTGATVNRKMSSIRKVLKKAKRHKLISAVPEITRYSEAKGSLNWLNFGEEAPVLHQLQHRGYDSYYDLVCFLLDTGCRISEALNLNWQTVRENSVTFENRKNGQFGSVPLTNRAKDALKRRRSAGTDMDHPFGDIDYDGSRCAMKVIYEGLGGRYKNVTQPFHIYRHSCASRLAIRGVNAKRIMEWMDHSSLIVTQRYMKLSVTDLDEARDALEPDYVRPGLRVVSDKS